MTTNECARIPTVAELMRTGPCSTNVREARAHKKFVDQYNIDSAHWLSRGLHLQTYFHAPLKVADTWSKAGV